ncbi:MAG: hypothetical protein K2J95_13160 [Lachnospiraceae bacterium]|nr:hypothetical protein [Lachnospiraceae bacterium]
MREAMKKEKFKLAMAVVAFGCLLTMGLFFWYKTFAYYTHDIHTYELEELSEDGQITFALVRLKNHYETVIQNNSTSDIIAAVYEGEINPVLLQDNIRISQGEEYWFDSGEYAYKVLISGEDITEDNVNVEASTLRYLKDYRKSVVITMLAGIVWTVIWAALIIAAPEKVRNYGVKINMTMVILLALGSIISCLVFLKGYLENDLCFLALLCTAFVAALRQGKRELSAVLPKEAFLTAGIISMSVSCLIFNMMLNSTESSWLYIFNAKNKMSLPDYAFTVLLFLVLFMILSVVFLKNGRFVVFLRNHIGTEFAVCGMAVTVSFLVQQEILGMAGNIAYFASVLLMLVVFYIIYEWEDLQNIGGKTFCRISDKLEKKQVKILVNVLVYLSYAVTIVAATISTTVINYFHMDGLTQSYVHHVSTYFRPMYYVINNISAESGVELYGHYAFLYKIPMEIFGANLMTVGIMTGIIGGLTAFFAIGTIHMLTKSGFLRFVGAVAVMDILCNDLYLAIIPHRLLFPMMILFYIVWYRKRSLRWFSVLTGFFIGIIAVFWNTETGVVVLITWAAFWIFKTAMEKGWKLGHVLRFIAGVVGIILLALVLVSGIFVLYNVLISGITLSDVMERSFGVLLNWRYYMFSAHLNFIRWTNAPWIYIMIFLLGMVAYGISGTGLLGGNIKKKSEMPVIISVSVMGLGQLIYFISRPEDYSIMILPVIFCMIYILDTISQEVGNKKAVAGISGNVQRDMKKEKVSVLYKRMLSIIILFGLCCILVHSKDICGRLLQRCINYHQLDYELLKEDLAVFAEQVPKDAYTELGRYEGLAVLYLCLGWEAPQDKENAEYMITGFMTEDADYEFIKEIPFGEIQYYLYRKQR